MKEKNKGFTLIELLATLVILSVIMTIAVVSFNVYVENANKTYYENLENTTKSTMIDYFADNRGLLPKNAGTIQKIDLQVLIDGKYLEQIVDAKGKSCIKDSTGTVKKLGPNKYDYKVCIKCPSRGEDIGDGC